VRVSRSDRRWKREGEKGTTLNTRLTKDREKKAKRQAPPRFLKWKEKNLKVNWKKIKGEPGRADAATKKQREKGTKDGYGKREQKLTTREKRDR